MQNAYFYTRYTLSLKPTIAMINPENTSEEAMLTLLADGNEDAFRHIFSQYAGRIYQVALGYLKSGTLAEEVVQDVFIKVWTGRAQLRQVQHFEGWLFIMSRNHMLNYLEKLATERKALHSLSLSLPRWEETTDHRLADRQYEDLLREAVVTLSPMQKDIYRMAREEQLTYDQIGRRLGISALTVKTHMSRALRHLRHFFRAYGETLRLFISLFIR